MSKRPTIEQMPTDIAFPPLPPEEPAEQEQIIEEPAVVDESAAIEEPVQEPQETPESRAAKEIDEEHVELRAQAIRDRLGRAERLQRERDEMARKLAEYEAKQKPEAEEDISVNLAEDDLAEGKHLKLIEKKFQRMERQLQQYQQQAELSSIETRLKAQFPDFDAIVNDTTIRVLRESEPEIAATINANPDLYNKAVAAYKIIKKQGLAVQDTYGVDRARAQLNHAKPKPSASLSPQQGESALARANSFANGLTPELQAQLLKEMNEFRRNS